MSSAYAMIPLLSWDRLDSERKRGSLITLIVIAIAIIFAMTMILSPAPEIKREQAESLPPRLAKLIREKRALPKPPPPPVEKKKEEPKKEPEKKEEPPKPEKKKPKKEPPKKPEIKLQEKTKKAKAQAQKAAAVFDSLAGLRNMPSIQTLQAKPKSVGGNTASKAKTIERSLITSAAATTGSSGGVTTTRASNAPNPNNRVGQLSGAETTKIESQLTEVVAASAAKESGRSSSGKSRRTTEEIQLVFSRNKSAINAIYRRALRQNPTLEGTVVLALEIQPNGTVSKCEVVSSELDDPALEQKIVSRVKLINFGNANVEVWDDTYSISFFPS